jgi:arylsulfatase A-like enzyme
VKRPNILVLYCDQLRWDALACNGNPDVKTPNLDRLASQGTTLRRFFVQNPVCMPSRVSFLTGQYPSTLGITHMGVPVPLDTMTLPRMLGNYGYRSANVGKLHFLPHANRDHREPHPRYGFDVLEESDEPGPYEDAYRAWVRRQAPEHMDAISPGLPPAAATWYRALGIKDGIVHPNERHPKHAQAFRGPSHLTHSAFVADRAMDFIRESGEQPWLCIAGFYSPHSPWIAPQEFLDLYDASTIRLPSFPPEVDARRPGTDYSDEGLREARRGYYAQVSEVDHHCGRILALLDERGTSEDTIVVFSADHGDWLGEHLKHGKGYPGSDQASRVPLLVRYSREAATRGRASDAIVEALDVVPTLLDWAGVPIPPSVQGRSLLPLLCGESEGHRDGAITEARGWKALRTARYRYVCESSGAEHLWDIDSDPGEYHDVLADPRYDADLAALRHQLLTHVIASEHVLPRVWNY